MIDITGFGRIRYPIDKISFYNSSPLIIIDEYVYTLKEKRMYLLFKWAPKGDQRGTFITSVTSSGDKIILGTSNGIYKSDNLKSWSNISINNGLSGKHIERLSYNNDKIALLTRETLIHFNEFGGYVFQISDGRYNVYPKNKKNYPSLHKIKAGQIDLSIDFILGEDLTGKPGYHCLYKSVYREKGTMNGLSLSFDDGRTWKTIPLSKITRQEQKIDWLLVDLWLDDSNINLRYKEKLYISEDNGENWNQQPYKESQKNINTVLPDTFQGRYIEEVKQSKEYITTKSLSGDEMNFSLKDKRWINNL